MSEFWSSFVPQLLATIAGALIGVASVIVAFRLERRAADNDAFEQSVERLLLRIDEQADALDRWQKIVNISTWQVGDRPPAHPYPGRVSIAIELMRLKAPAEEQATVAQISSAWDTIAQSSGTSQRAACGVLAGAVVKWRAGEDPASVANALRVAGRVSITGVLTDEDASSGTDNEPRP